MLRKVSLAAILAGAVGVPYAVWNGDQAMDLTSGWFSNDADTGSETDDAQTITPAAHSSSGYSLSPSGAQFYDPTAYKSVPYATDGAPATGEVAHHPGATITGPTMTILAGVLRLDVSHAWVTQRFTRVTTTLADTSYDGLRVPLVSGTTAADVTGSLTYYFDRQQQLQRITFHGTTGDTTQLVALLTQYMEFEKQDCLGGELYTRSYLGQTTSVCRIRPASVLRSESTNSRYEILLELNRDQWKSNLSETAAQLVE